MEAENIVQELPSHVLENILSRLPVSALLRFKCVSKQWYDLISNPWFVNFHHQRSKQNPSFVYASYDYEGEGNCRRCTFSFTSTDINGKVRQVFTKDGVRGGFMNYIYSANGLICFSTHGRESHQIYICNPATRELHIIPRDPPSKGRWRRHHLAIGFGYLSSTQEYKIMRFLLDMVDDIHCELFNLSVRKLSSNSSTSSSSWKVISKSCSWEVMGRDQSLFVQECLHWIAYDHPMQDEYGQIIVSFDLKTEKFRVISMPLYRHHFVIGSFLVDFEGCLSHFDLQFMEIGHCTLRVCTLKDYEKCTWIVTCNIDLLSLWDDRYSSCNHGVNFQVVNGELVIIPQKYEYSGIYLYYNIENKKLRKVQVSERKGHLGFYSESIISLSQVFN